MYGYCKFQEHCQKEHIDIICSENTKCENNGCVKRHPKPCKYFTRYNKCKFDKCAYLHVKEGNIIKIEDLEKQVSALTQEMVELKKTNHEMVIEHSNNIAVILERLKILEQGQKEHTERYTSWKERPVEQTADMDIKKDAAENKTETINTSFDTNNTIPKEDFNCDQCNFKSNTIISLNKHTNTKHAKKVEESDIEVKICNSECSLCEDRFSSELELKKHKDEHIEEIEGLDIASLTNEHDLFECNLCSFESGYGDSIREHLIEHVNPPLEEKPTKETTTKEVNMVNPQTKSLLDEYDDDGNYIGDDPKYMDSDDEIESESEEEP